MEANNPPIISFFVAGTPRSTQTGSIVRVGRRAMPLRRNRSWSAAFGLQAKQYALASPLTIPLKVWVSVCLRKPKTTKRAYPSVAPDLENFVKGLLDSCNGVLWKDDAQIVTLILEKRYSPVPGIALTVWPQE